MDEQNKNIKTESVSYKELIYFKEEIFSSLKQLEKKIMEKTKESLEQFDLKIKDLKTLINKYQNETNIFLTKNDFQEEKKDIINQATNKKMFDEKFTAIDVQISAIRKDMSESNFKYDKIFIDQLTLPGIIGNKCKYKSIRDYIKQNIDDMSNVSTMNLKAMSDLKSTKGKLENRIKEFSFQIDSQKQQLIHTINLKIAELNEKLDDRFVIIEGTIKKMITGEPIEIKSSNNDLTKNNTTQIYTFKGMNKVKKELNEEMNEANEKGKKKELALQREIEVIKSEFNYVKKTLYELAKVLMMELENGEGFNQNKEEIINNFFEKTKLLVKESSGNIRNKKITREKTLIPKRKEFSSLRFQYDNLKSYIRMKTGAFHNYQKKSSFALNQNDNLRRFSKEIDINENNLIDMKFNIMNKSEGNNLLYLRQNQRTKTQRNKLNSNIKLELRTDSISTINNIDEKNENEKKNIIKPILKPSTLNFNNNLKKENDKDNETISSQIINNENIVNTIDNEEKIIIDDLSKNINNNSNNNNILILKKPINDNNNINNNTLSTSLNKIGINKNNSEKKIVKINDSKSIPSNQSPFIYKFHQRNITTNKSYNNNRSNGKQLEFIHDSNSISSIKEPSMTNPSSFKKLKMPFTLKKNVQNSHERLISTLESVPDSEIIDIPLIPFNKNVLEIDSNKSGIEKKLIELEFFTKKKFDELVNEIKNFIPIHFNSYIRDYKIVQSPYNKRKIKSNQTSLNKEQYFYSQF
jgi:hypothetical protein